MKDARNRVGCVACGHPLARTTPTCPNCATPQPHKRLGSTLGLGALLVLLLAVVLYGLFGPSG